MELGVFTTQTVITFIIFILFYFYFILSHNVYFIYYLISLKLGQIQISVSNVVVCLLSNRYLKIICIFIVFFVLYFGCFDYSFCIVTLYDVYWSCYLANYDFMFCLSS